MKYILLTLIALSAVLYPVLMLTSCTEEEMQSKEVTRQEAPADTEEREHDIEELEAQAEIARERLIESLKETASRPESVRGLGRESVNINATEENTGANENSEVLI